MKNFFRVVQIALRFKPTIAMILICSLMVAVFWGTNISAIYPVVDVVFRDKTIGQWAAETAQESKSRIAEIEAELADLQGGAPNLSPSDRRQREHEVHLLEGRREAVQSKLAWAEWGAPLALRYLPNDAFQTLALLVGVILVGTLIKLLFLMSNMILVERLAQLATFELRKQFYRQTLRMDVGAFSEDRTAHLMSRFTNDMNAVKSGLTVLFGKTIREPLKMTVCLALAGVICWRLLLLCLVISPLGMLVIGRLAKSIKRANRRAMEEMAQLYSHLSETFSGILAVKAYTMERYERNRFHATAKQYYRKTMRIMVYNAITRPVTELMGMGVICLAILAGGYLVLTQGTHLLGLKMTDEPLSVAAMITFYALLVGVSDPARKMADVLTALQKSAAASERIFEMMDREPAITDPESPLPVPTPFRELVFDDVSFSYTPDMPVLRNINLRIPFGQTMAVVGPNGCGKSTLMSLVSRFYDVQQGAVRFDDVDVRRVRVRDLRAQIGIVTQQTWLFDESVLDNIRYGCPEASEERVIEASREALAHSFIESNLERGYHTKVGERGGKLSGGQRQRIALARAILRNPALLILDEATSQVDIESEQLIHQALRRFMRGRTTIMITHRLTTLSLADRIIVMDDGRVVDDGTHEELMAKSPIYQRLHQHDLRESA